MDYVYCPAPDCGRYINYGRPGDFCFEHGGPIEHQEPAAPPKGTQECSSCRVRKPLEEFSRNAAMRNGRNKTCKACRAAYDREWNSQNRETRLPYMREKNRGRKRVAK